MRFFTCKYNIIFLFLLFLYGIVAASQLLLEPHIWPDEAYLADIAGNILKNGTWGTNLWGNLIFGAQNHVYWYPPLYLLSLAGFFKIFGNSIFSQRIFSVIIGGAFLYIFYILGKSINANYKPLTRNLIIFLSIILLITDTIFQKGTRIGRPETLVLFFISLGLYLFVSVFNKTNPKKDFIYFLAGLSMGLASISHLLSVLFFIAIVSIILIREKSSILKSRRNLYLFLGFIIPLVLWIIIIFPNYYTLLKQLSLQRHYHKLVISHIEAIYRYGSINGKIAYIIYITLSLLALGWSLIKKNLKHLLMVFILLLGWFICIFGKLEWYSIYLLPFIYFLSIEISYAFIKSKKWPQRITGVTVVIALVYLAIVNINPSIQSYNINITHKQDYENLGKEITAIIPRGKSVYLSSIPDLYFVLRDKYTLYQFPPLPPKVNEYLNLLDQTDYVVINNHLEAIYVGGLLSRYADINKTAEYTVGRLTLYPVQVIELISRNQRYKP